MLFVVRLTCFVLFALLLLVGCFFVRCLSFVVCRVLCVDCCSLFVVRCLLYVVCWLLFVVLCLLAVVRCSFLVACIVLL